MTSNLLANAFGSLMALGVSLVILLLAVFIVILIGWMKMFAKAGKPRWAAIIPVYNLYVLLQIVTVPVWWMVPFLLPVVLELFGLPSLVVDLFNVLSVIFWIVVMHKLAKAFGYGIGFTIGLVLLNPIFVSILGYGKSMYRGGGSSAPSTPEASQPQVI